MMRLRCPHPAVAVGLALLVLPISLAGCGGGDQGIDEAIDFREPGSAAGQPDPGVGEPAPPVRQEDLGPPAGVDPPLGPADPIDEQP